MVVGDGHPALGGGLQDVLSDALLVDRGSAVQGDPHAQRLPDQGAGHAVAIIADLDVGIPADLARLPVRGVVPPRRQRLQRRASRAKRSATPSWTVPLTRGSASSRSHCPARWLRCAQLSKAR